MATDSVDKKVDLFILVGVWKAGAWGEIEQLGSALLGAGDTALLSGGRPFALAGARLIWGRQEEVWRLDRGRWRVAQDRVVIRKCEIIHLHGLQTIWRRARG